MTKQDALVPAAFAAQLCALRDRLPSFTCGATGLSSAPTVHRPGLVRAPARQRWRAPLLGSGPLQTAHGHDLLQPAQAARVPHQAADAGETAAQHPRMPNRVLHVLMRSLGFL